MRRTLYIALSAVALVLASAASYALASSQKPAAATSTIRACKNKRTGALFLKARCPKGYSRVVWNVRGPAGPAGPRGASGTNGANGTNATSGANGAAASVSVESTSTGAPGSSASVTNVGSSSAAKLNFTIPQGPTGATGPAGTTGAAGAAGTSPWLKPTVLNNNENDSVHACPYSASTSSAVGTPATSIDFNGSTYVYTGSACKTAATTISGPNFNQNTPDVDPSDWTEVAAAGQNGTADAWAFIDPGVCAGGGSCSNPVIAHGGVAGSTVGFQYNHAGQYQLTITGCPASTTPASGQPFPADISVTPEGAYPGESANDSSLIWVTPEIRDTTSLGVFSGLGAVHAFMYLGVPDSTTVGQTDAVDEPFAVSVVC
ncbi:MAG: hypothetical protein ACRDK8_08235 [Solirubrobacteraceae bacterium]